MSVIEEVFLEEPTYGPCAVCGHPFAAHSPGVMMGCVARKSIQDQTHNEHHTVWYWWIECGCPQYVSPTPVLTQAP